MIGKIATGRSFSGCMSYLHEGRYMGDEDLQKLEAVKKAAQVIHYNQCFGTKKELVKGFIEVSKLNPKVSKPVFHASISFAHADSLKLTTQDKIDIVEKLAEKFGFNNNQYVAITHADTEHEHLHVVANRIGYNGKTASDSNSYRKMSDFCRSMEKAYKLETVLSPAKFMTVEEKLQHKNTPRIDQRKEAMKADLKQAVKNSKSLDGVVSKMTQAGYKVDVSRGIAFTDDKRVRVKGSQLGYSLENIKKQLQAQQKERMEEKQRQYIMKQILKQREETQEEKRDRSQGMRM